MTGPRSTLRSRRLTSRLVVFLSILLLAALGCFASNDPFTSAAFPTPQASLFTSAGLQLRLLDTGDLDEEFTLVAFERMIIQGGNQSDISIDISRSPQPIERYLFVIDRSRHSVTVLNADTQDIPEDLGDVHVSLTLEVTDPVALAGYVSPDTTVFRFAVQYVSGFVRIVDVESQTDAVVELTKLTEGTQSTLIQTQLVGLRATLKVDVLDLDDYNDEDGLEQDVRPISRQDKPQQPLRLGDSSAGGSVNIEVRLEEEAPPLAVLPPPTGDIKQPESDEPPGSDDQPSFDQPEPPPQASEQNEDETSSPPPPPPPSPPPSPPPPPPPPPSPSPSPSPLSPPPEPDKDDDITTGGGGDPSDPYLDIVVVIDDSSNWRTDDPLDERLEAVRAFLSATLEGDRVGLVRFSDRIYRRPLTRIIHSRGKVGEGGIDRLRSGLDIESNLTTGLTPSHLGLIAACDELDQNGQRANRIAILVSDGASNVGVDRSEYFDPVEECFKDNGWQIYTVGIGNYREKKLQLLADNTGGVFRPIPPAEMAFLTCDMQAIRADHADGTFLPCRQDIVLPNQPITFTVNVPAAQMRASFNLNWIGRESDIELRLVRPDLKAVAGRAYLPYDNVSYDGGARSGKTLEVYGVKAPDAGTWRVEIIPKVVPPEGTLVVFGFNAVPKR